MINRCLFSLLLAILLLACHSNGGRDKSAQVSASFKNDTALINKYAKLCQRRAVPPDSCLTLLHIGYDLAKKHGLSSQMARMIGTEASVLSDEGNLSASQLYIDSAFRLNEISKDISNEFFLNEVAASIYHNSGNFAKAATYYLRAIEIAKEMDVDKSNGLPILYHNVGALMLSLKEDSLAREYMLLAQHYALQQKPVDSGIIAGLQFNLAQTYLDDDSALALNYCRNAFRIAKKFNVSFIMYDVVITLTESYMAKGQYDSAGYYLRLAKENNSTNVLETETLSASLALLKKDYRAATTHLQRALKLTTDEDYDRRGNVYKVISRMYADRKQYQKAYEYYKKYMEQYQKKLDDPKKTVADFMVNLQSLENEKKMMQKQAQLLAKDTAIKKRNFWIGAMSVLLVLLGVILVMAYRNYSNRRVLLNERMKALQQNQEIDRLKAEALGADKERSRIAYDLHDGVMVRLANVRTNLNLLPATVPGFCESPRYPDIMGQLELAALELRNTAHNLMPEILLEDGIPQALFYFCKATAQASGLTIKFLQIGEPLPRLQMPVEMAVYRIVQELVQNIIRHAEATTSLVQLHYRDSFCAITVEDDGRGIPVNNNNDGYGLKSIRNRVKVLNGIFDLQARDENGTTAYVEFDVRPFLTDDFKPGQAATDT